MSLARQREPFKESKRLLGEGVYVRPNGLWYVSITHTRTDAEYTLAAAPRALAALSGEESA